MDGIWYTGSRSPTTEAVVSERISIRPSLLYWLPIHTCHKSFQFSSRNGNNFYLWLDWDSIELFRRGLSERIFSKKPNWLRESSYQSTLTSTVRRILFPQKESMPVLLLFFILHKTPQQVLLKNLFFRGKKQQKKDNFYITKFLRHGFLVGFLWICGIC